jgi:hypothetical protein
MASWSRRRNSIGGPAAAIPCENALVIPAAVGFRAKTGRAIAVVLCGRGGVPSFVWRDEVSLVDPEVPATAEPYHEVMELAWDEAGRAVQPLVSAIQKTATAVMQTLIARMRANDVEIRAAGVVGSPPRDISRLGNPHIRAHAAEGILFRRVLEEAAAANALHCRAFSDREMKEPLAKMKTRLDDLRHAAGAPWRGDERMAATAAWMAFGR